MTVTPMEQSEIQQAFDDLEWWQQRVPPGWGVSSWTFRHSAFVVTPDGYTIIIYGAFVDAMARWLR